MLCWAREQGYDFGDGSTIAVFCDTGWEHPKTIEYIDRIDRELLGGNLVRLKNDQWFSDGDGMRTLVARRGRVPSARARFCTEELKVIPMTKWLRTLDDEATVYVAVRAAESVRRAKLPEREWSEVYDCWVERPLLHWSTDDVFACLARHAVEPNPLYKLGAGRVGCFPCVMINHAELRRLTTTMPEIWDRIGELERLTGRSFFSPGYIPERACSGVDPVTGKRFPRAEDVRRWVIDAPKLQIDLFDTGLPSCLSVYSLCE
jgi:3'-phosphoadenosine 5'-phosphosulfate sulfotransferase (PAPS reductase)/FAD synthetase